MDYGEKLIQDLFKELNTKVELLKSDSGSRAVRSLRSAQSYRPQLGKDAVETSQSKKRQIDKCLSIEDIRCSN